MINNIKRMNFMGTGYKYFTYKFMIIAFAGWIVFLGSLYGIQHLRQFIVNVEIKSANEELAKIENEKELQLKLIQKISRRRVGISSKKGLTAILSNRPMWFNILGVLTKSLPAQVWLDSVAVIRDKEGVRLLEVKGRAKTQRMLTTFIMDIEQSSIFDETSLITTKQTDEGDAILFDLTTRPAI